MMRTTYSFLNSPRQEYVANFVTISAWFIYLTRGNTAARPMSCLGIRTLKSLYEEKSIEQSFITSHITTCSWRCPSRASSLRSDRSRGPSRIASRLAGRTAKSWGR